MYRMAQKCADFMNVKNVEIELLEMVEGTENVERMDALLSLAVTGGDYEWI